MSVLLVAPMQIGAKTGYTSPAFVASSNARNSGSTTTVTKPTGTQSGDFLVAIAQLSATTTTVSLAGWTSLATGGTTNNSVQILYRVAGGSEPASYAFVASSGSPATLIQVLNYRGATSILANNLAAASFASADPQVASSISVIASRILLAALHLNSATATLTTGPSGMTSRSQEFTGSSPRGAVFDLVNPSTGASGTKSFDISTSTFGAAFLIEIQ